MNISSLYLKAFFQLSQTKSFTEAASDLAITQSAFSQRIKNLEEDLGATLFIREKNNIQLTESGSNLLRYCEKVYKLEEEFIGEIQNTNSKQLFGTIRIGGFSSILRSTVIPALSDMLKENNKLSINLINDELSQLDNLLRSSRVDFILSNKKPKSKYIKSEFLGFEDNVLVESKKYKFNNNYLDHDSKDVTTSSYFKLKPQLDSKLSAKITKRYLDDVYGLIDGVKHGLGRAVLPLHLIKNEKDLKVVYPKTKLRVPIYLQYYDNQFQTKLEKAIVSNLKAYFLEQFKQV